MATSNRLAQLAHFVCEQTKAPADLGSVKLNKILCYADRLWYARTGKSMTGARYVKQPRGPVAEGLKNALDELARENKIAQRQGPDKGGNHTMWMYFSLAEPDLREFSHEELSLVERIREAIVTNHTAQSISEFSHDVMWEVYNDNEEIPLRAVYTRQLGHVQEQHTEWARSALRKQGILKAG